MMAISKTTVTACVGTALRVRANVRDKATRAAKDLAAYTVAFAIKTTPDETSVYVVASTAGTGDALGHLDVAITDTAMETVDPGDYVGEFTASLAGAVEIRVQIPIHVEPRVIV